MKKELAIPGCFIVLLLCVYFYPVFQGGIISGNDWLYCVEPWKSEAPAQFDHPSNKDVNDDTILYFPWARYYFNNLKSGVFPLWNPQSYCGIPFIGAYQGATFFPTKYFCMFLPFLRGYTISLVARLIISFVFMYLFLRQIGVRSPGATFGAVSYSFCGPFIAWFMHTPTNVYALLPAALLGTEWIIRKADTKSLAFFSMIIGLQFFGGHPGSSFQLLLMSFAFFILRILSQRDIFMKWPRGGISLAMFLGGIAAGAAVAAIQLFPFGEYLLSSHVLAARLAENAQRAQPWMTIITLLVPKFFGSPIDYNYRYDLTGTNYIEQCGYAGIVTLTLALAGMCWQYRKKHVRVFSVMACFFLVSAYPTPLYALLRTIPPFTMIGVRRFLVLSCFSLCILAGFGVDSLCKDPIARIKSGRRTDPGVPLGFKPAGSSLIFIIAVVSILLAGALVALGLVMVHRGLLSLYLLKQCGIALGLFLCTAGIVIARRVWVGRERSFVTAVIVLLIADIFLVGWKFVPVIGKDDVIPRNRALEYLQNDRSLYRVLGLDALQPNANMLYDLSEIRGYDEVMIQRYWELQGRIGNFKSWWQHISWSDLSSPELLNLLNVKYIIMPPGKERDDIPPAESFDRVYNKGASIYRNRKCLPRAFMVRDFIVTPGEKVLDVLCSKEIDLATTIVLEEEPPIQKAAMKAPTHNADDRVSIEKYAPNHIVITAQTSQGGLLFLSDVYYPGWKAFVDGEETKIYRANYTFRSVCLGPGDHRVEFRYRPTSFLVGAIVSVAAVVGLALACFWAGLSKTRGFLFWRRGYSGRECASERQGRKADRQAGFR